ncbi:MAG: His/Gly/Thr/Pro-type tRNA ligase C-terminal domain-containing protein, partial [Pseudomonadota bacterium]
FTSRYARTDETHDEALFNQIPEARRRSARGIEVGQIFYFGTKYSDAMNATVQGPDGKPVPVHMGSHGIGVSRLAGALIEANHDENGIIWPWEVAPFHVGIVNVKQGDSAADTACAELEAALTAAGIDVLYDDREERAGAKFATMDLIGVPQRITVGPRGLANGVVELTDRRSGESEEVSAEAALAKLRALAAG